jgi:hypothetical protein
MHWLNPHLGACQGNLMFRTDIGSPNCLDDLTQAVTEKSNSLRALFRQ